MDIVVMLDAISRGSVVVLAVLLGDALALEFVKDDFAHADVVGRDLDILVGLDVLEGLLEAEDDGGHDLDLVVGTAGTHVGEFLGLGDVDDEVFLLGVLADDLSAIDILLREDEEASAVLQLVDGVGIGRAAFHGDE